MDLRQIWEPFEKKYVQFSDDNIKQITNVYHNWQCQNLTVGEQALTLKGIKQEYENIPEFCYSASFEEIAKKDFSLVPSKYIEFINRDENIDFDEKMASLQEEFSCILKEEEKSKNELLLVFKKLGYEIKL
jgi:type I restriction enzyme M protein